MRGYVEMSSLNAPDNGFDPNGAVLTILTDEGECSFSLPPSHLQGLASRHAFECGTDVEYDRIELSRATVFFLAPWYFSLPDGEEEMHGPVRPFITSAALLLANGVSSVVEEDVSPRYLSLAKALVHAYAEGWKPPAVH
jgi:hypothetical protein